jgi:hypothetical protein
MGKGSGGDYVIDLPSGYTADGGFYKFGPTTDVAGGSTGGIPILYNIVGKGNMTDGSAGTTSGDVYSYLVTDSKFKIGLIGQYGSTNNWYGNWGSTHFHLEASTVNWTLQARIKIAGWSASFNPVLSMPLVNIGADTEYYQLSKQWTAAAEYSLASTNSPIVNTIDKLGVLTNSSTADQGFNFRATTKVKVHFNWWNRLSTGSGYNGIVKCSQAYWNTGYAINNAYWDNLRVSNVEEEGGYLTQSSASVVLEPGEVVGIMRDDSDAPLTGYNWVGGASIVVERDRSHTNMAHIIKPAVCALKDLKAYNQEGGNSSTGTNTRVLNSIEGESWFVTGSFDGVDGSNTNFSLEPGVYKLTGNFEMYKTDRSFCWLYDVTNSTYRSDWVGNASYQHSGSGIGSGQTHLNIPYLAITSSTTFNIKHYVESGLSSEGWGVGHDQSGYNTCYATLVIEKLK